MIACSHLKSADIVICSTSCPHSLISLEDARLVARARQHKADRDD